MAINTKSIGTGVGSAGTGNVDTDGTTAVTSGSVATAFTTELTAPGTIEIAGTLFNIASITDDDNLVTVETVPTGTNQSYNIGLRAYSTISLWEGDLDDQSGGAGNDAIGEIYNDSVFDEDVTVNDGTPDSVKLTVPSSERHDGTDGTGARIVRTSGPTQVLSPDIDMTLEWLEIDGNGQAIRYLIDDNGANNDKPLNKLILHGSSRNGTCVGFRGRGSMTNCIVYDILNSGAGGGSTGILHTRNELSNCTVHDIRCDDAGNSAALCISYSDIASENLNNNLATDPGGSTTDQQCYNDDTATSASTATNMSSDATSPQSGLRNVTTADQYVSTTGGSEDLHLKSGADAIDAGTDLGTTPTGVNIDIDNRDRDAQGDTWDISAHEFVSAAVARTLFSGPIPQPVI